MPRLLKEWNILPIEYIYIDTKKEYIYIYILKKAKINNNNNNNNKYEIKARCLHPPVIIKKNDVELKYLSRTFYLISCLMNTVSKC